MIDYIAIVLGGFAFIAYISYFIKLLIWPEGIFPFVVCIAVMVLSSVPIVFHARLAIIIPAGIFKALKYIYFFAASFYAVTFVALTVYIYSTNAAAVQPDAVDDETVIIVYGAGLDPDGTPGNALRKRLNKAIELAEGSDPYILVTGGQGFDEPCTEASAMKDYIVERGINKDKIILEEKSSDTKENIRFSFKIIKEMGLEDHKIVSISNEFHVPRIRLLCSMYGVETEFVAADDPAGGTVFASLVREYMSYVKAILSGRD